MIKKYVISGLTIILCFALGCTKSTPTIEKLDINAYLELGDPKLIYPTSEQMEMLQKVVPEKPYQLAPPIENREYWKRLGEIKPAQVYFQTALADLQKAPEIPISDEIYYRANREGNRGIYKPRYYRTMERLEAFIIAECMENEGRFIPQIEVYCDSIMAMKSWLHPNHDRDNDVIEGRRVSIDLGARKFGVVLALANTLLEEKLSEELSENIMAHLQWRIMDTYLNSCQLEDDISNTWIRSTSNWNSVCTSGTVLSTILASNNYEERIATIGCALNSMVFYLSGFGQDGYCSEGTGYWRYGFGHYFYLAEVLYDYTDGKIDLFEFNNPEKLNNVANFPENFQIHTGMYAPFSDGVTRVKESEDNFAYLMAAKHYGAQKPTSFVSADAVQNLIFWSGLSEFLSENKAQVQLPDDTYFDDFGIVISRGKQEKPLSVAVKAGHNAENHNHMDVGSYVLVCGEEYVAGDIGAPSYRAGAFSDDNPARSSWGHPVPRVENTLQSPGIEFRGEILETAFTTGMDKVVMDLKPAYEVKALQSLERTLVNNKSGLGSIIIQDKFSAEKAINFGTAISTFSSYEIVDESTILLTGVEFGQKVKVLIESEDGEFEIVPEAVPVEHLRSGEDAKRIGIEFKEKLKNGAIKITYKPII